VSRPFDVGGALRRSLVRGAVLAVGLAVVFTGVAAVAVVLAQGLRANELPGLVGTSVVFAGALGLLFVPLSTVEVWAASLPPSRFRAGGAALITAPLALVAFVLLSVQVAYALEMARLHDPGAAIGSTWSRLWEDLAFLRPADAFVLLPFLIPVPMVVYGRLSKLSKSWQAGLAAGATLVCFFASLAALDVAGAPLTGPGAAVAVEQRQLLVGFAALPTAIGAALLPPLIELADALERKTLRD
jgi:hypothetical protein